VLPWESYLIIGIGSLGWAEILETLAEDAPWLATRLSELSVDFPDLEQYREGNYADIEDIDVIFAMFDFEDLEPKHGPNPVFYQMSSLFSFDNLQRLRLHSWPTLGDHHTLPSLIKCLNGQKLFQQLKILQQDKMSIWSDISG
jgi:hypothetical protein